MQPIRRPLTIVGIVGNVVAVVLVCVLLYDRSDSKLPSLRQLARSIEQIGKTKKVTPDDLKAMLGKPEYEALMPSYWHMVWHDPANAYELNVLNRFEDDKEGSYRIAILGRNTYRRGIKYLYGNALRAFDSGRLFPFEPYRAFDVEYLTLTAPK